jgi:hypothetical protein
MERLLRLCAAAKKHNVKLILSSWFFLHTNWFCEEKGFVTAEPDLWGNGGWD